MDLASTSSSHTFVTPHVNTKNIWWNTIFLIWAICLEQLACQVSYHCSTRGNSGLCDVFPELINSLCGVVKGVFVENLCSVPFHFRPIKLPWYNHSGWLGVKHQVTYVLVLLKVVETFFLNSFPFFVLTFLTGFTPVLAVSDCWCVCLFCVKRWDCLQRDRPDQRVVDCWFWWRGERSHRYHHRWGLRGLLGLGRLQSFLVSCRSGGRIFFSRVSFLCWLLFQYVFHPRVTAVACKSSQSSCQKCMWQVTATPYICGFAWSDTVHGCMVYTEHAETAADSCGISHASAVSTPLRWI